MNEIAFNFDAVTRFRAYKAQRRYEKLFLFFPFKKKQLTFENSYWELFCKKGVLRCVFAKEPEVFWIVQSRGTLTKLSAL